MTIDWSISEEAHTEAGYFSMVVCYIIPQTRNILYFEVIISHDASAGQDRAGKL